MRSDEGQLGGLAHLSKVGALRQEAVTRMDGVRPGDFRRRNNAGHVQIALGTARRPNAHRLIGKADVEGIAVGLGIDGDRADTQLFAGTNHPQGDFTTIGDQDFLEHDFQSSRKAKLETRSSASFDFRVSNFDLQPISYFL